MLESPDGLEEEDEKESCVVSLEAYGHVLVQCWWSLITRRKLNSLHEKSDEWALNAIIESAWVVDTHVEDLVDLGEGEEESNADNTEWDQITSYYEKRSHNLSTTIIYSDKVHQLVDREEENDSREQDLKE